MPSVSVKETYCPIPEFPWVRRGPFRPRSDFPYCFLDIVHRNGYGRVLTWPVLPLWKQPTVDCTRCLYHSLVISLGGRGGHIVRPFLSRVSAFPSQKLANNNATRRSWSFVRHFKVHHSIISSCPGIHFSWQRRWSSVADLVPQPALRRLRLKGPDRRSIRRTCAHTSCTAGKLQWVSNEVSTGSRKKWSQLEEKAGKEPQPICTGKGKPGSGASQPKRTGPGPAIHPRRELCRQLSRCYYYLVRRSASKKTILELEPDTGRPPQGLRSKYSE